MNRSATHMHLARRVVAASAALTISVAALMACSPGTEPDDTVSSLTLAGVTELKWDPINGGGQIFDVPAIQAVYDNLVLWNQAEGTFDPWLLSDYTVADDRLSMEMNVREGVAFTDGETLNADAVVKLLTLVRDTPTQTISFVKLGEAYGAEFEAVDEYTVLFTTTAPIDHAIFQVLDNLPVPSPAALDDPASLATTPVGSGPYILDKATSTPGVELNFVRNEDYWNPEAYPYDTLTIKTFGDNIAALNALKSGQIDATVIDVGALAEAEAEGFASSIAVGRYRTMFFGDRAGEINPAIADPRVRQAINLAFDREAINTALDFGLGGESSQPFISGQAAFLDSEGYGYDPEGARELLAEAGYADGFDLVIPTLAAWTADFEPIVQQYLGDIGITVIYEAYPDVAAYLGAYTNYAVMMRAEAYVNTMRSYLQPGGSFSGWGTDPDIEALVARIDGSDGAEKAEAGQELGEFLRDEAWFAPISQKPGAWASIPEVTITLEPVTASIRLLFIQPTS